MTHDPVPPTPAAAAAPTVCSDAIATLNVGVCVWELEEPGTRASLRLVAINPAAAKFLGVKIENVLGKRIHEGFPGSEKIPLPGIFTRVAETGEGMVLGDVPYVDEVVPDGVFSIRAHSQGKSRTCVEFTNVTEQRKAEKKVAAQHEELTRARDPGAHLSPFFATVVPSLSGKAVLVDFREFEYMNSAMVSPLIHFVKNLDAAGARTTLLFDTSVPWQKANAQCMRAIARNGPGIARELGVPHVATTEVEGFCASALVQLETSGASMAWGARLLTLLRQNFVLSA